MIQDEKVRNPKAYLDKQKKVEIKILKVGEAKKLNTVGVTYNGYTIQIPVGDIVKVPEPIAEILRNRGLI